MYTVQPVYGLHEDYGDGVWLKQITTMHMLLGQLELAILEPLQHKAPEEERLRTQLEVILGTRYSWLDT